MNSTTTSACPKPRQYWKDNPALWPVDNLLLGSQVYATIELKKILEAKGGNGDASLRLAGELIAAKLNLANGSDPAPVSDTIADADALLAAFEGKLPYFVRLDTPTGQEMASDVARADRLQPGQSHARVWSVTQKPAHENILLLALLFSPISPAVSAEDWGAYQNRPLDLRDLVPPDGRRFSLPHEFNYLDPKKQLWEAPSGLIVDGATIPMPFWSVIGGPFSGRIGKRPSCTTPAAARKTRPWREVHRMFYEGMRCSGVGWVKAKTMYLAVYAFGPRWKNLNSSMPKDCLLATPSGTPPQIGALKISTTDVAQQVVRESQRRALTLPEARAVARPFFNQKAMSDQDAKEFVAKLKTREPLGSRPERDYLSVLQSEWVSDEEVRGIEQWVERESPPLEKWKRAPRSCAGEGPPSCAFSPRWKRCSRRSEERSGQLP